MELKYILKISKISKILKFLKIQTKTISIWLEVLGGSLSASGMNAGGSPAHCDPDMYGDIFTFLER